MTSCLEMMHVNRKQSSCVRSSGQMLSDVIEPFTGVSHV